MTSDMGELGLVFRSIEDYLREQRAETLRTRQAQHAGMRQMFASGRIAGGVCDICGDRKLHAHAT